MSTRAQVKIVDGFQELWFYRHSDGYPEGAMPTLQKFLDGVKSGKIRNNVEQAGGWLILIGAEEYLQYRGEGAVITEPLDGLSGWKVGSYEPCACRELHGDVEWLYTIDLKAKTIEQKKIRP